MFLAYIAGVLAFYIHLQAPAVFTALLLLLNLLCLFLLGNYLLRAVLFPYANRFVKRQLDSGINTRFSLEFARLVRLMAVGLRVLNSQNTPGAATGNKAAIEAYYKVKKELRKAG